MNFDLFVKNRSPIDLEPCDLLSFLKHPIMSSDVSFWQNFSGFATKELGYYCDVEENDPIEIMFVKSTGSAYCDKYLSALRGDRMYVNYSSGFCFLVRRLNVKA